MNIPGITVTVQQMLETLRAVGGDEAVKLVEYRKDADTEKIVLSWPTRLDTSRAQMLGFAEDGPLEQTLRDYVEDYGANAT